jgi:hypothetical protein
MSRHGQCRCGVTLTFRKRHGYKARCPGCGKVVRLQPDGPASAPTASLEVPDAFGAPKIAESDPLAKMVVVVDDVEPVADVAVEAVIAPIAEETPWTWQWLAVAGGLVVWVGSLSILAWWWLQ